MLISSIEFSVSVSVSRRSTVNKASRKKSIAELSTRKSKTVDIFNDPLYNKNGSRNLNIPFSLFALRKKQIEREEKKKPIQVSKITETDEEKFQAALKRLKREKAKENASKIKYLKNLVKAKETEKDARQSESRAGGDREISFCPLTCPKVGKKSKSEIQIPKKLEDKKTKKSIRQKLKSEMQLKKPKPVINYPPIRIKSSTHAKVALDEEPVQEKKPRFPVVVIPPFKTRKWVPPPRIVPKKEIKIDYPPLKLRKT